MLNKVRQSTIDAKSTLSRMLLSGDVTCQYKHCGRLVDGFIINYLDSSGVSIYEQIRPDVRVRSHTGKEYLILLVNVVSVSDITEL